MQRQGQKLANAVFEGGGVKGIGLVGAVAVFEEGGYRWSNLAGTSAGAIVAALLAAGYSSAELKETMAKLDYNKFKDLSTLDKVPPAGPLGSLIFEKGIYEGKYFESWMEDLLHKKKVFTFANLINKEFQDEDRYRFKLRVIARYIKDEQFVRTIPIPTLGVGTTEFDISKEKSDALYQAGRQAAEKFLATWDFAAYVEKYRNERLPRHRTERLRPGA